MSVFLWPVFFVWMGLGPLIGLGFIALMGWCGAHLLRDVVVGDDGELWCPVFKCAMRVHGTPRGSSVGAPFVTVSRCEQFGNRRVTCKRGCLRAKLAVAGAA